MDAQIINGDNALLSFILRWLRDVETKLDSHQCGESRKGITHLLEKLPTLLSHRIAALNKEELPHIVDDLETYRAATSMFHAG